MVYGKWYILLHPPPADSLHYLLLPTNLDLDSPGFLYDVYKPDQNAPLIEWNLMELPTDNPPDSLTQETHSPDLGGGGA